MCYSLIQFACRDIPVSALLFPTNVAQFCQTIWEDEFGVGRVMTDCLQHGWILSYFTNNDTTGCGSPEGLDLSAAAVSHVHPDMFIWCLCRKSLIQKMQKFCYFFAQPESNRLRKDTIKQRGFVYAIEFSAASPVSLSCSGTRPFTESITYVKASFKMI